MEIRVHQKHGFSRTRMCRHPGAVFSTAPARPPGWLCPQSGGPSCLCLGWSPRMPTITETGILLNRLLALLKKHSLISLSGHITGSWSETHRFVICTDHLFFPLLLKSILSPRPTLSFLCPVWKVFFRTAGLGWGWRSGSFAGSSRSSEDGQAVVCALSFPFFLLCCVFSA